MGNAAACGPAVAMENIERAQILDQPVGQRTIELQHVAVGPHRGVAQEVLGILVTEEILAGRHRPAVVLGEHSLQLIVERIAGLLVPTQPIGRERIGVGQSGRQVEASIGVDRELVGRTEDRKDGFDAPDVLGQRRAADLHLDDRVPAIEIALHLVLQRAVVLVGIVIAAGGVDEDRLVVLALAITVCQQTIERNVLGLRHCVPDRHVEHADRDRALAVAAGLLVRHHRGPNLGRIEQAAIGVEQGCGIGIAQPRNETLAQQALRCVAAVRVEAVAHDRTAVAHSVGDDRDHAHRHLAEVDIGVAQVRLDRNDGLSDVDDPHLALFLHPGLAQRGAVEFAAQAAFISLIFMEKARLPGRPLIPFQPFYANPSTKSQLKIVDDLLY